MVLLLEEATVITIQRWQVVSSFAAELALDFHCAATDFIADSVAASTTDSAANFAASSDPIGAVVDCFTRQ